MARDVRLRRMRDGPLDAPVMRTLVSVRLKRSRERIGGVVVVVVDIVSWRGESERETEWSAYKVKNGP